MAAVVEIEVFWGRGKVVERQNRHWWGLASSHCQVHDVCSVLHAACCALEGRGEREGERGREMGGGGNGTFGADVANPTAPS